MSLAIEKLEAAQRRAMAGRPMVDGFPYLAETLRQAGVTRNVWCLPACESLYLMADGPVVMQGDPLVSGIADVPPFDRDALIKVLKSDQAGGTTFPEFLRGAWQAGVVRYEVDLQARTVHYFGCRDEVYVEAYPAVRL